MRPPLLDRLADHDPVEGGGAESRAVGYREAVEMVAGDLERLLNAKRFPPPVPESCGELRRSVLVYGLPDFTGKNPADHAVREALRREIEGAISLFEPRLRNTAVRVEEGGEGYLRFQVTALLAMDREGEPVSFVTILDAKRGEYRISR